VYRSISDPGHWIRNDLHRRITGLQVRRAARVLALWPAAASSLRRLYGVPAARIWIVPNARDERVFRPPTPSERAAARAGFGLPDRPVAAFIGRLSADKRVEVAIDAVTRSSEHVLLIAGDGPDRMAAERRSTMLAPGRVVFLGELDDIVPVLHAADVVLITSDIEGMPGVAIEAVMCGVPVIAPDIGALSTMPGVHVAGSDVGSFSDALDALLSHSAGEIRDGAVDAFSWASVSSVWDAAITTVGRDLGRWC
jgi:glycosyltransferase involved in cell wall biosynthesis